MSNLQTIAAFEAKTHFSSLLERVAHGEEITITRHGKAIARLLPIENIGAQKRQSAAKKLKQIRGLIKIKDKAEFDEWQEFRAEGRK
jgi:prevent-host-death family protein